MAQQLIARDPTISPGALHQAARHDNIELAALLLEHAEEGYINEKKAPNEPQGSCTALHYACYYGSPWMVRLLLENGADPNIETSSGPYMGSTPLQIAAFRGLNDTVELLVESRAQIDAPLHAGTSSYELQGRTMLWAACWQGDWEQVQLLLKLKANPNPDRTLANKIEDQLYELPVLVAAGRALGELDNLENKAHVGFTLMRGNTAMIDSILEHKGDPNTRSECGGDTALHWLSMEREMNRPRPEPYWYPYEERVTFAVRTERAKILLEHHADPNAVNKDGNTPLSIAKMYDNKELIALLEEHGAKVAQE